MKKKSLGSSIFLISMLLLPAGNAFAGDLAGTVTDLAGGQPIVGLDMNIYDSDWNYLEISVVTSAGGAYRFMDLPAGSYYVRANPRYPFRYQYQYWPYAASRDAAVLVQVPETGETAGIDFSLQEGWFILGKVSELQSGAVLEGISIRIYDTGWNRMDLLTETDQYGRYYAGGLPAGIYYVMADPAYPAPYVDQYFDHSPGPVHAVTVTLTPPDDLLGISFELDSGNYILGQVTDKDTGNPIPGIRMKAYNSSGSVMRVNDRTESDGRFVLGAYKPGEYYVRADPAYPQGYMDQYYPEALRFEDAEAVNLTLPKPFFDANLALSAGSYMRGIITGPDDQPLIDIKVKFYDREWNYIELATTYTRIDGTYLSGALKPGMYYAKAVPIYPQPWIDEFYPDAVEQEDAGEIPVALASETVGIDMILDPGGYLTGMITHLEHSDPISGIDLDVYDSNRQWVSYSAHSRSNGSFVVGALPFGIYYIQTDPTLNQGFVPLFYQNAFMPDEASPVSISTGQNADNLDFLLFDGGFVSGRVTEVATGDPLQDVDITILDLAGTPLPLHAIKTDASGNYTAYGIPQGSFLAAASMDPDDEFMTQYYENASTVADASPITVTAGQTTADVNFNLIPDPKPTATPAVTLGVSLELPSDMFRYKDLFYLNARVGNPGQVITGVPLFVILDVAGELFFWPSWVAMHDGFDYQVIDVDNGVRVVPILPPFEWPKITGTMTGLHFYGGMTRPDFSRLLGDMDVVTFGFTDE